MKIYTLILAVAATISAAAQPDVKWLETAHNFGAFSEETGPLTHSFKFINTGTQPLVILAAHPSCGCTSPNYSRTPIAPGDTGSVDVTYDPAARPGRFSKYVGVDIAGIKNRTKLYVSGTVVGTPASVAGRFPFDAGILKLSRPAAMMGKTLKSAIRNITLQAYNSSLDTITPHIENLPPYIDITLVPSTLPPGEQMSLIIYFRGNRCPQYGLVEDTVMLFADKNAEPTPLPIMAMVEEDFSRLSPKQRQNAPHAAIEPTLLSFDNLTPGQTVSFAIKNTGKNPLEIRRIYTADKGIDISIDRNNIKHGKSAVVTISARPEQLESDILNARISIISNDPDNPVQTVRVTGQIIK